MKIRPYDRKLLTAGFTLIELLLGFSIFGLIAVTLYAVFSNGVRINSQADKAEQLYRELRWSLDTLTMDLENMVNYESYADEAGPFRGSGKNLSLLLPSAEGLKIVRYSLQPPEQTKIFKTQIGERSTKNKSVIVNYSENEKVDFLMREEMPFFVPGDGTEEKGEPDILSTHIQPGSLRFSYGALGEAKDGAAGGFLWKDEWSDVRLPAAVRVELSFVDPDDPKEPLVVRKDIFIPAGSWGPAAAPALE